MENKTNTFGRFLKTLGHGVLRFLVPFLLTARAAGLLYLYQQWEYVDKWRYLTVCGIVTSIRITEKLVNLLPKAAIALYAGAAIAALVQLLGERRLKQWVSVLLQLVLSLAVATGFILIWQYAPGAISELSLVALIGLIIAAILFGLAVVCTRGSEGAGARSAVTGVIVGGAVGSVLAAALIVFTIAVDELLYSGVDFAVYLLFALLSFGTVGVTVFLSFLPRPGEQRPNARPYTALFSYFLLPLYLVLLAILYVYLGVILVRFELPSNQLNPFGLLALAGFFVLWFALKGEDNRLAKWYTRWGGLLLLPVTGAQILALAVRILAYGLTENRVLSLFAVALGIVGIVFCTCRVRLHVFCAVAAVLTLAFTLTPLNPMTLSNASQARRLKAVLTQYGMLDESGALALPEQPLPGPDYTRLAEGLRYFQYASGVVSPFDQQMAAAANDGFLTRYRQLLAKPSDAGVSSSSVRVTVSLSGCEEPLPVTGYDRVQMVYFHDAAGRTSRELFDWLDPVTGELILIEPDAWLQDLDACVQEYRIAAGYAYSTAVTMDPAPVDRMLLPIDETHTLLVTSIFYLETETDGAAVLEYRTIEGLMLIRSE